MIILRKEYASEGGVSGIRKVKNRLHFPLILKNLMKRKAQFVRL